LPEQMGSHQQRGPIRIQDATVADLPFLTEMLVEAAYPLSAGAKPTPAEVLANPSTGLYMSGWGRPGDFAVIADDENGRRLGAAWYRRFPADGPGYGFVAEGIPELAIAVVADARGRGVGRRLLTGLIEAARLAGESALSLSVNAENSVAHRLYRSAGFERVGGTDDSPTMLLRFESRQD
jgi:GNAT superfamily N-acetyltransferase